MPIQTTSGLALCRRAPAIFVGDNSGIISQALIASTVATTLDPAQPMPSVEEQVMMTRDPLRWRATYRDKGSLLNPDGAYRQSDSDVIATDFGEEENTAGAYSMTNPSARATQIWLFGDGEADLRNNTVVNQVGGDYDPDNNNWGRKTRTPRSRIQMRRRLI